MVPKILYLLMSVLIISTGTAFAQESLITVKTDDNNYDEGDTIVISGVVSTIVGDTPVTLQLFTFERDLVDIAQIQVAQDGSYSHTIIVEGPKWQKQGDYTLRATYGEGNVAEVEFSYTPESKSTVTTNNFEVDAGSYGTFDVEYTIKGGTLENMFVDSDSFGIMVEIQADDDGSITIDLPREFIGAEKQDGKDEIFIVLIDGIGTTYEESVVLSDSRIITIDFEDGDSEIAIIGTYVVPEFGVMVMVIMIIGITAVIFASKNRFQIKI